MTPRSQPIPKAATPAVKATDELPAEDLVMPFFFVNANRERFPITHMFDIDGDEISEPDDAFSLVARLPSGKWLATQCERHQIVYEPPTELSSQDRGT